MTEVKKWKVYLQKLLFIQIIYTFSRSIYIKNLMEAKLQKSKFLSNFMPYDFNVICYGVNREVRQQLTSSAIL